MSEEERKVEHRGVVNCAVRESRRVRMNGVTQYLVHNERFMEKWTVFNTMQVLQRLRCDT